MGNKCSNYNFNILHIIIPPVQTFTKLCVARDKTEMFIICLLRIILWFYINYFFSSRLIYWILILNIISFVITLLKFPEFSKDDINIYAERTAHLLEEETKLSSQLEKRSLGRTEAIKTLEAEVLQSPHDIRSIS